MCVCVCVCICISIYFYISIHLSIHPFDLFSVTLLKVFCTTNLEPTVVSTTRVERAKMGQPARPQFGPQKVPKTVDAFTKGYMPRNWRINRAGRAELQYLHRRTVY